SITVSGNSILASHANAAGWGTTAPVNVQNGSRGAFHRRPAMPNPIMLNGTTTGSGAMFSYANGGGFSGAVTLAATSGVGGANNFSISGNISGAGGLTKIGAGTLTLTGNNTF